MKATKKASKPVTAVAAEAAGAPEKISTILGHTVAWSFRGLNLDELPDDAESHIKSQIREGFLSGQLCHCDGETEQETFGWWRIDDEVSEGDPSCKTIEIFGNTVEWWYRDFDPEVLPESEREHIESAIEEGYLSGELVFVDENEETRTGWWKIR